MTYFEDRGKTSEVHIVSFVGIMQPLVFQRSFDNTFFYIQKDIGNGCGDSIMNLHIDGEKLV